jgi:hypothetical protein
MTDTECCTTLSGVFDESTTLCKHGNLGARKYDFYNSCYYVEKYNKGIKDSGFPKSIAEACYVIGATVAYFIPSASEFKVNKDIPPPYDTYDKRVISHINLGGVVLLVVLVATIFLIKRIRK